MKPLFPLLLILFLSFHHSSHAEATSIIEDRLGIAEGDGRLPGIALAEGFSQITGVAVSPLLGVSAIGTWKYFTTPEAQRDELPWICHPLFWGIGLSILLLCFFKDTIGNVAPGFVKKPLDFLEVFEDKFSAIIAGSAFVPFVVQQYSEFQSNSVQTVSGALNPTSGGFVAAAPSLAMIDSVWLLLPIALVGFFTIWIVSHAITVLAAISPFRILEVILKSSRLLLLGLMTVLYALSPAITAILCLILLIICTFLAPRAFRLSVYGTVIGGDFLRSLVRRRSFDADKIRGFLVKQGSSHLKKGSFGKLRREDSGAVQFKSRWFLLGHNRRINLPAPEKLYLADGVIMPTIRLIGEDQKETTIIHLIPSLRHCSDEAANELGIPHRETAASRGLRAAKRWLGEMVSRSSIPGITDKGSSEAAT